MEREQFYLNLSSSEDDLLSQAQFLRNSKSYEMTNNRIQLS